MRDPDGYVLEVGQYTQIALEHFKKYSTWITSSSLLQVLQWTGVFRPAELRRYGERSTVSANTTVPSWSVATTEWLRSAL